MATMHKRNKHSRRRRRRTAHKWSAKYKKSINCRRPRGFSQRQHCKYGRRKQSPTYHNRQQKQQRFNQSGGDILNYLPSDVSMSLRSLGNAFSTGLAGVKGFQPAPSPLPYNDHKLQKTEVKVSERIPDIRVHYQNAMNLIPSL
jgi:hypothetical protein